MCVFIINKWHKSRFLEFDTFTLNYARAQQQTFTAKLTGQNEMPPIKTGATGTAKFTVNSNDTLNYEMIVNNIDAVIGARISLKNGSLLAEVFNPYAIHNGKSGIPTGQINGVSIQWSHYIRRSEWSGSWQKGIRPGEFDERR